MNLSKKKVVLKITKKIIKIQSLKGFNVKNIL